MSLHFYKVSAVSNSFKKVNLKELIKYLIFLRESGPLDFPELSAFIDMI